MKRLAFSLGLLPVFLSGITPVEVFASSPTAVIAREQQPRTYPSFDSQRLDQQLVLYQQMLEESGPPDILIVGSSRALQGVDPVALQLALAHYGYPGLRIFNFGINGATAQVVDLLLRKILTPDQLPRMIIFADGVRAFNSGRVDRTYQAILASEGYNLLARGVYPLDSPTEPKAIAKSTEESAASLNLSITNNDPRPALVSSYQLVNHWFTQVREEISGTYQQQLQQATWFPGIEPPPLPTIETVSAGQSVNQLHKTGFLPVSDRYNPVTYYQKYPRVPGRYDGDYANFRLDGEQTAAILSIANFTRSRRIPLVVVNLPLSADYLSDSLRMNSEQQFRQHMQRLSQEKGFIFRDLSKQWPNQNDYFADPSHINRYGAFAVSMLLAQDQTIPWLRTHN